VDDSTDSGNARAFDAVHHASFVLRCWTDTQGGFRARLIDVLSGVSYPVAGLIDLETLIEQLMARSTSVPKAGDESDVDRRQAVTTGWTRRPQE
jgi:hypothetical protein